MGGTKKPASSNWRLYCCFSDIFCCCFHESISEINKSSHATIFLNLARKWTEYWALFEMIAWAVYKGVARRLFSCVNLHRNRFETERWVVLPPKKRSFETAAVNSKGQYRQMHRQSRCLHFCAIFPEYVFEWFLKLFGWSDALYVALVWFFARASFQFSDVFS